MANHKLVLVRQATYTSQYASYELGRVSSPFTKVFTGLKFFKSKIKSTATYK